MKNEICLYTPTKPIEINEKEALRYMGMKNADEKLLSLISEIKEELEKVATYRGVYTLCDVLVLDDFVTVGALKLKSSALSKNLKPCDKAFVFAVTIGIAADRLINKMSAVSSYSGLICDALCSAAIENFTGDINDFFKREHKTRPRFSPGFGDLALSVQSDIIKMLNTPKNIGLSLTESLMMIPTKSVTAICGIERI